MLIYTVLRYFSNISILFCVATAGYYIWYAIKSLFQREALSFNQWIEKIRSETKNFAGKPTKALLIISLVATIITNTAVHQLVGIHNLKLKPDGTYCFYVEAHRSGGKTYTLPAQVRVEKETVEYSDSKSKTITRYYIKKVFFSNGGWLDTGDCEDVSIGEPIYFYDSDDDEWELTLLNEHAYSPYIEESNNAGWLDITFMLIEVLSIGLLLYALCREESPENSQTT